ncbi:hypothetical protein HQ447_01895 [bacterium]|nr:hypothetical protein [bacterium]
MPAARTAILACLLLAPALAGTSTDYSLEPAVLDRGGMAGSSADYALNPSIGPGAAGASVGYVVRGGFSGMLNDASSLVLAAAGAAGSMNERATLQLEARIRYDDDTVAALALPAANLTWSVAEGPLAAINSAGLATAGSVYQDTPATAMAVYQGVDGRLPITVRNLTGDDFGSYAADDLPDTWQVLYFGESGIQAAAGADADSDGLSNLQEYAFGLNPSQGSSGMLQWSGSNLLERGVAKPFASRTAGGFIFRAVFARRKDFAAAGLTYTVEFSGDLATWKASTSTPSVLAEDGEIQAVSVPYPFFVNGKKATYFRVKVQSR